MEIKSLELKDMCFYYADAVILFANVNFTFPDSRIIRINSKITGKSTLLKILAGTLSVSTGQYLVNGIDISQMSYEEFLPIRMKIGYGFDSGGLLNNKTLLENILLPLQYHKIENSEARVKQLIDRFELDRVQHLRPFAVSGSHRKATCLVRAFVLQPSVLILDEPDAGLKEAGLVKLCETIEESLEKYNLRQVIYTSEDRFLQKRLGPEELWMEPNKLSQARMAA